MKHDTPAIFALERLHAELGGKIKDNKTEAARLAADMRHVEAVIRMLEPGYDVTKIAARRRYKVSPYFKRGECFRHVLDILRKATTPLTSRQIAVELLRLAGVENAPTKLIRDTVGAVHSSLRNHTGKSVRTAGEGMPVKWRLIGDAE